jgi:hypothetical protein
MPIYDLYCKKCDTLDEKYFSSFAKYEEFMKNPKCEECGGELTRDYSEQNLVFSMKSFKKLDQEDARMDKTRKRKIRAENIKEDPYFDMRKPGETPKKRKHRYLRQ